MEYHLAQWLKRLEGFRTCGTEIGWFESSGGSQNLFMALHPLFRIAGLVIAVTLDNLDQ